MFKCICEKRNWHSHEIDILCHVIKIMKPSELCHVIKNNQRIRKLLVATYVRLLFIRQKLFTVQLCGLIILRTGPFLKVKSIFWPVTYYHRLMVCLQLLAVTIDSDAPQRAIKLITLLQKSNRPKFISISSSPPIK